MDKEEGLCVGCGEFTTSTVDCDCARTVSACGSCRTSDTPWRCGAYRERERRQAVYPCLDFRGDPESGGDTGGCLLAASPAGARGSP